MFTRKNLQLALRREAQAWVLRLASGQATEADGAAFRQWCGQSVEHARAFKETRAAWQALQPAARARAPSRWRARARAPGRRAFLGGALAPAAPIWRSGRRWTCGRR